MNKAIILLSGGLDSLVALGYVKTHGLSSIKLAITFNYGQKAVIQEIEASKKIAAYFNIEHKVIELDWLKDIISTSLVSSGNIPNNNFGTKESASAVWVPNRNALFLNIAACYCDSFGYNTIIFGANKDEANNFSDNTEEFRTQISRCFESSTLVKPKVLAPLINYSKNDIVKIAVENNLPLELVRSCYGSSELHCGNCESCYHLKRALIANNCERLVSKLFKNDEI